MSAQLQTLLEDCTERYGATAKVTTDLKKIIKTENHSRLPKLLADVKSRYGAASATATDLEEIISGDSEEAIAEQVVAAYFAQMASK